MCIFWLIADILNPVPLLDDEAGGCGLAVATGVATATLSCCTSSNNNNKVGCGEASKTDYTVLLACL
jgi:hypothetical protein